MDKISRFIDCYIETETCNLRCHYCYITQKRKFNNKLIEFQHTPDEIRKALSKERLGGTCLFNFCAGGETLLVSSVLPVIKALIEEGHYVMVVTNGVLTAPFFEFATWDSELLKNLFIKFSFHYLELVRINKLNIFFDNVKLMKDTKVSFTVEITPSDELVPHIEDVQKVCLEKLGAISHVTIARNDMTEGIDILSKYSLEEYKAIWGVFNSALFEFKTDIINVKRTEYCNAGDWSLYLNINSGKLKQCYCGKEIDNIYNDVKKPLNFEAIGHKCTLPYCYNGHAFLTIGTIAELETPTYAALRDRDNEDGENWLQPEMRNIMSQKLKDNRI